MKKLKYIFAIISSLLLFSCQIGLGTAPDMIPPAIKVTSPEEADSVGKTFVVKGKATDNLKIRDIKVTVSMLDDDTKKYEYSWSAEGWQIKNSAGEWEAYAAASADGTETELNWIVPVVIEGNKEELSGKNFAIVSTVHDTYGNESSGSMDERSVQVDLVPPTVSIIEPSTEKSFSAIDDKAEKYKLQDSSVLQYITNGTLVVSGTQKEDTSPDYLFVRLDQADTLAIDSYSDNPVDLINLPGAVACKKLEGDGLRNWEVKFTEAELGNLESDTAVLDKRPVLRLVTESHDKGGNVERKVQGWFLYDNKADNPWTVASFGDAEKAGDPTGAGYKEVYPNSQLQGQAYDDDGLASFELVTEEWDSVNSKWVKNTDETRTFVKTFDNSPKYYAYSLKAISVNKVFRVTTKCTDINGKKSAEIVRYMKVMDVTPPEIVSITPAANSKIFDVSEENGDVTFTVKAHDDGSITEIKLIHFASNQTNSMLNYYDKKYKGWFTEENNNIIKILKLDDNGDGTTTGTVKCNLFTDFGISASEPLSTQNFAIRILDNTTSDKNGNEKFDKDEIDAATISFYSLQGDISAPELKISKLTVKNKSGTTKDYLFEKDGVEQIPDLEPFVEENGEITDTIMLSGTWSDDSTTKWNDSSKIGDISVTWAGAAFTVTKNPTDKDGKVLEGVWITNDATPKKSTTETITASITDYGKNKTEVTNSYTVKNSNPQLLRINALTADGSYKADSPIYITLEYNKAVEFSGSGAKLNLNTGNVAVYDETSKSNGTAKHVYKVTTPNKETENTTEKELNVVSIDANGSTWYETGKPASTFTNAIPAGSNLADLRNIIIDTTSPTVSSFAAITGSGYYGAGSNIFMNLTFSEEVVISEAALANIKLKLNIINESGTLIDVYSNAPVKTGSNTLLFSYSVTDGHNANPLSVVQELVGGSVITDKAGNSIALNSSNKVELPSDLSSQIVIDTKAPAIPVTVVKLNNSEKTAVADNGTVYLKDGVTLEFTGFEENANKEYSLDGGSSWRQYTGAVSVTQNGTYKVRARQDDQAGNPSDESTDFSFTIDSDDLIENITSTENDGTYIKDDEIYIKVVFRNKVSISDNATLKFNGISTTAVYNKSNVKNTDTVKYFKYKVKEGDSTSQLNLAVNPFTGTIKDKNNTDITSYVVWPAQGSGKRLCDNRQIEVITTPPAVKANGVTLSGTTLTIQFTSAIIKNPVADNIEIAMAPSDFKAPAILTKDQYSSFDSGIQAYYEAGTNGADSAGKSDLSEKYVLKYKVPGTTTDLNGSNTTLCGLFTAAGAHKVEIPIGSKNVNIVAAPESTAKDTLQIELTGSYALPVKGAEYTITLPADLVKDKVGQAFTGNDSNKITPAGVEKPVIRINKALETVSKNAQPVQPLTAGYQMDCQTPGAEIYYTLNSSTPTRIDLKNAGGNNVKLGYTEDGADVTSQPAFVAAGSQPTTNSNTTVTANGTTVIKYTVSSSNALGSGETADIQKAYKYLFRARAYKETYSADVYEAAMRTVITLYEGNSSEAGTYNDYTYDNYRWIRGGTGICETDGLTIAGFPYSWNKKNGTEIRAMTKDSDTYTWYWVTWSLNTTSYVHFLAGDMPGVNLTDENASNSTCGPDKWWWSSCGWVPNKSQYPIYPGESTYLSTDNSVSAQFSGFAFLNESGKHNESR